MNYSVKKYVWALILFVGMSTLNAQNKVPNLQDLIGVRGSSAEYELGKRGYKHITTSKTNYDSYSNWWHETAKKCVTIRVNNGRVKSAVYAPPFDCKKSSHSGGNSHHEGLQSIVGDNASSAENQMERMGYRHMNTSKSGSSAYANWWNKKSRKCVTVRVSNGVVKSVREVPSYDCEKHSNNSSGSNAVKYNDLVGWKALKAYDELESRGFREVRKFSSSGKTYRVWFNRRTDQCIKTLSQREKITEIIRSTRCN